MGNKPTETIYARVPKELAQWLKEQAEKEGRSIAGELTRIIMHAKLCDKNVLPQLKDY